MTRFRHVLITALAWLLCSQLCQAQAPSSVLKQIPDDAQGFVVARGFDATMQKIDALTTRLQAPVPKLGDMLGAFEEGLDTKRPLGVAWLPEREGDDPQSALTHFVLYVPVTDYAAFVEQLEADDASAEITEASLNGDPVVVANMDDFAAIAQLKDRESLQQVLHAKGRMFATTQGLHAWLDQNDVSVALSPSGTKLLFARLRDGLELIRAGAASVPGGGAKVVEASLDMYRGLFDAAEKEFSHLAVGLRIDAKQSLALHARALLASDGEFAKSAQSFKKPEQHWVGIPAGPYVLAFEGPMPSSWSKGMMSQSFNVLNAMQGDRAKELTKEQMDELSDTVAKAMQGVKSMAFAMGVGEPGSSVYSRTVVVFQVDDAKDYIEQYEKSMKKMSEFMSELTGLYEVQRIQIEDESVIRLTMDMSKFQFPTAENAPNLEKYFETMFGPGGKMSVYIAPAEEKSVVMAYTSPDNLKRAQEAIRGGDTSFGDDIQLQKTSSLILPTAQWVGYVSPGGAIQFGAQMAASFVPDADFQLPDFPASPPIGMAATLAPSHLDGQLVVPIETIDAVMKFIVDLRQAPPE